MSLPVCMDHTKISKVSIPPAHTMSPLLSTVIQENCAGRGEVKVRKLRYLNKINVRLNNCTPLKAIKTVYYACLDIKLNN